MYKYTIISNYSYFFRIETEGSIKVLQNGLITLEHLVAHGIQIESH